MAAMSGTTYLEINRVEQRITEALGVILDERPADPLKALGALLAIPPPPKAPPVHAKSLFDKLDTNGDGVLQFDEAQAALAGKMPPSEYQAVFNKFDEDGNGTLDYGEFVKLCRALDKASFKENKSVIDRASSSSGLTS